MEKVKPSEYRNRVLAGNLYEAKTHIGRYLEKDPPPGGAWAMNEVIRAIDEVIRYHEAVANLERDNVGPADRSADVVELSEYMERERC